MKLINEQGGQEERAFLQAQAQALEGFGKKAAALQGWKMLAEQHPFSTEGRKAQEEIRRLTAEVAALPYLGVSFAGDAALVEKVVPGSPADKAGLQAADRVRKLDTTRITSLTDLRKAIGNLKAGDRIQLTIERKGQLLTLPLEVGVVSTEKSEKK